MGGVAISSLLLLDVACFGILFLVGCDSFSSPTVWWPLPWGCGAVVPLELNLTVSE